MKKTIIVMIFVILVVSGLFVSCKPDMEEFVTVPVPFVESGSSIRSRGLHFDGVDPTAFVIDTENFSSFTDFKGKTVTEEYATMQLAAGILQTTPLVPTLKPIPGFTKNGKDLPRAFTKDFISYGLTISLQDWDFSNGVFYFFYYIFEPNHTDPIGVIHYSYSGNKFSYLEIVGYNLGTKNGTGVVIINMKDVETNPSTGNFVTGIDTSKKIFVENSFVDTIELYCEPSRDSGYERIYLTHNAFAARSEDNLFMSVYIPQAPSNYTYESIDDNKTDDKHDVLWLDGKTSAIDYTLSWENKDISLQQISSVVKEYCGVSDSTSIMPDFTTKSFSMSSKPEDWRSVEKKMSTSNVYTNPCIYDTNTKIGASAFIGGAAECARAICFTYGEGQPKPASKDNALLVYKSMGFAKYLSMPSGDLDAKGVNKYLFKNILTKIIDGYNPKGSSLAATMVTDNLLEIYSAGYDTSDGRTFAEVLAGEPKS